MSNMTLLSYDASMACVFRRFQEQPYQALDGRQIRQAIGQQASVKVPPHVSRDSLRSFYGAIYQNCDVTVDDPSTMPFVTRNHVVDESAGQTTSSSSRGGENSADWRVRQITDNERRSSSKVCHYFTTKEGCRRGPNCPYTHSK